MLDKSKREWVQMGKYNSSREISRRPFPCVSAGKSKIPMQKTHNPPLIPGTHWGSRAPNDHRRFLFNSFTVSTCMPYYKCSQKHVFQLLSDFHVCEETHSSSSLEIIPSWLLARHVLELFSFYNIFNLSFPDIIPLDQTDSGLPCGVLMLVKFAFW